MASAYRVVTGGHLSESKELNLLAHITRYGYGAIYGRPLTASEIMGFNLAEHVQAAYHSRSRSENWATRAAEHRDDNRLLNSAMIAAGDNGDE